MSNARLRLVFARRRMNGSHVSPLALFFRRAWGTWFCLREPPGFFRLSPLVGFADKALRALPTRLPPHKPTEVGL
jgi:hypothetical protein